MLIACSGSSDRLLTSATGSIYECLIVGNAVIQTPVSETMGADLYGLPQMEPYFTTKSSGTGLGLLIVDRIVRAHGGELTIESRPGEGAAFTISLPRHARMVRQLEAGKPAEKE